MVKPNFSQTESSLVKLFRDTGTFKFQGKDYTVLNVGKPSPSQGECKTDVYIQGQDRNRFKKEFKISIKQNNADFLENKMRLERAKEIFGMNAQRIIENSIASIKPAFESDQLVYVEKKGRTGAKSIKLGWKFELMNKQSGAKSGLMRLTDSQKVDIYAGTNLGASKTNSRVNNQIIQNSGIAEYMLETTPSINQSTDFYMSKLVKIDNYVKNKNIYFACKALNYRAEGDKWDGDRSLAVYVDWQLISNKLIGKLVYSNPLSKRGNEIGENLRSILRRINISSNNFKDIEKYLV